VFISAAPDLVANDNNGAQDVFLYDRVLDVVTLVSHNLALNGSGNGSSTEAVISGDGNYIAFSSNSSDLVANDGNFSIDVLVYERAAGTIVLASRNTGTGSGNGASSGPSISDDGRYVAFQSTATNLVANDANGNQDVFVYDRVGNSV